jgi:hypothetical protein
VLMVRVGAVVVVVVVMLSGRAAPALCAVLL